MGKKSLEQGLDLDTVKIITGLTDKELKLLSDNIKEKDNFRQ